MVQQVVQQVVEQVVVQQVVVELAVVVEQVVVTMTVVEVVAVWLALLGLPQWLLARPSVFWECFWHRLRRWWSWRPWRRMWRWPSVVSLLLRLWLLTWRCLRMPRAVLPLAVHRSSQWRSCNCLMCMHCRRMVQQ